MKGQIISADGHQLLSRDGLFSGGGMRLAGSTPLRTISFPMSSFLSESRRLQFLRLTGLAGKLSEEIRNALRLDSDLEASMDLRCSRSARDSTFFAVSKGFLSSYPFSNILS